MSLSPVRDRREWVYGRAKEKAGKSFERMKGENSGREKARARREGKEKKGVKLISRSLLREFADTAN
jgi:hypothetical protein